ncbi:MAG: polysaccharide deacetylase family protein [Nanoarchaeota archaeon]
MTIGIIYTLSLISSRNPLIVDDVYPTNICDSLLEKADILYIIPCFENDSINNNKEWCAKIKSLNKTIGLHGVKHSYHEFNKEIDDEELASAITDFENCFEEKPTLFRPPYNKINKENEDKIKKLNMAIYKKKYIAHPYCHCNPKSFMKPLNWILFC